MITRSDIVAEARTWIGTRWQHQARVKGVATDCIGLVGGVALALDLPGAKEWAADRELHNYGKTPMPEVLIGGCERFMQRIPLVAADVGDVLVMAFRHDPQHFAIISERSPMYIVHAYAQARRVVENGAAVARAKVLRAYRLRGVA